MFTRRNGYMKGLLRVDLTNRKFEVQSIDEDSLRKYVGGNALGARILYDETGGDTNPLGPDNLLLFMLGPFAGTHIPTAGRTALVSKSPLTRIWGEADVGGHWGKSLKAAGYDGLVILGKSEVPVSVVIRDGKVEFRQSGDVWGKDTYETQGVLQKELGRGGQVLCIGPAGEKQVKFAAIMTGDGRAAGRGGLGAVMGSKNLKAVVASGSMKTQVADEGKLRESIRRITRSIVENTRSRGKYGTAEVVLGNEEIGNLPIKNWTLGSWKQGAQKISGPVMAETILTGRYGCSNCPIRCGRIVEVKEEPFAMKAGGGPEYEALACLGSLCLVDDLKAIAKANDLCNRYGMDTISAGCVIAFAMEAYEKGIVSKKELNGLDLTWGNAQAMVEMTKRIGDREGMGDLLAEGVKRAAQKIGKNSEEFAIEVKGMECPAHDPRAIYSVAVAYATRSRGACHTMMTQVVDGGGLPFPELGYEDPPDRFEVEGKGILTAKMQDYITMFNVLCICRFLIGGKVHLPHILEWLECVTGWKMGLEEFLGVGERCVNLKRMYNVRCGISRKDDTLPPRLLTLKRGTGGAADTLPPLGRILSEYYEYRNWSEEGIPLATKLKELGLEKEIRDLPSHLEA